MSTSKITYIPVRVCDRATYRVIVILTEQGRYAYVVRRPSGDFSKKTILDRQGGDFASADIALAAGLAEAMLI